MVVIFTPNTALNPHPRPGLKKQARSTMEWENRLRSNIDFFAGDMKRGDLYSFFYNHGSGKWLYLKGKDPIGDIPIFTSMIMGGRVIDFRDYSDGLPNVSSSCLILDESWRHCLAQFGDFIDSFSYHLASGPSNMSSFTLNWMWKYWK